MKKLTALFLFLAIICGSVLCSCGKAPETDPIDDNYRVFYQIFVGSFSDSNNDGIGDIRGIINRMDYLNDGNINSGKSLGVQGIWLSPIFTSPSYHKYDASNYYEIDKQFGTMDDLKELIAICHERNVKIIIDLAVNHTAKSNLWFSKFSSARASGAVDDPYYDFYTCVDDSTKVTGRTYYPVPNAAGEYYEGNFSSGMPELNFDNPDVREEMVKVAKFYLDMGIDGFRFDAIKYIYFGDTSASSDFWDWYIGELKKINPDIYTVGECWSADAEVLEYYSSLNCFNFTTSQLGQISDAAKSGDASTFTKYIESYQKRIREKNADAMYCPFIANHDTDRAAGFLPVTMGKMQMAANLYILCCGSPFIYYGEEIGLKGSRGGANTDANRRLAMLWGDGDTVKDPVGATYEASKQTNGTVAEQLKQSDSLLNYYAKLISIRNKYPEIARGTYTAIDCGTTGGFIIEYNGSTICLFHNTSADEVTVKLPEGITSICDAVGFGSAKIKGDSIVIEPMTSVIMK